MLILTVFLIIANLSGNITQVQENKSMNDIDLDTIIVASIAGVALAVSITFGWMQNRHGNFQRLMEVYKMINDPVEREARKNIYKAYRVYYSRYNEEWNGDLEHEWKTYESVNIKRGTQYADIFSDTEVLDELSINQDKMIQDVEMVRATFDHIGTLFNNNLIPKEPLLEALWGTARVCWICLEDNIMIERDKRGTEYYMVYFKYLVDRIEEHRIKKGLEPVSPYREESNHKT
jgi:hypothetical protein